MGLFGFGKKKAAPVDAEIAGDDDVILVDDDAAATVIATPAQAAEAAKPAEPKKPSKLAATVGKGITLANFVIATLFLATAFFFHSTKVEVTEKRRELDQITRELSQLRNDRQATVDTLTKELEAEQAKLAEVQQQAKKDLGDVETAISDTRRRIDEARKQQVELSAEGDKLHKDQEGLMTEIVALRQTLETTLGAEEGLAADRERLRDLLAKSQNDLREATRRGAEIKRLLPE